jgi:glycosyltransferase involved in cell wall biosynthesis
MKVLIVGNYPLEHNPSMHYYAGDLLCNLKRHGIHAEIARPYPFLGRFTKNKVLGKWLGYVDRFIIFSVILHFRSKKYDLIHIVDHCNSLYIPFIRSRAHIITCHDMIGIRSSFGLIPQIKLSITGRLLQRLILKGLNAAHNIICVSEQTKRELCLFIDASQKLIKVIPQSLRFNFQNNCDERISQGFSQIIDKASPYIMHVGSNLPQKNRRGVVRIYEALVAVEKFHDLKLVIAGVPLDPELKKWLSDCGLLEKVFELGFITNEELECLYSRSEFLLFPSLVEGFGWPIIEAQACGCLVVTSDRPPMNEIGGQGAIYVDPENIQSAVGMIINRIADRATLIRLGYNNCANFNKDIMIKNYVHTYESVVQIGVSESQ